MPDLRFRVLLGLGAVALTGAAIGTFGFLRSRKPLHFPYRGRALSDSDFIAIAAKPGWRAHTLDVAPGIKLRGLLREPAATTNPWVLFFSGNSQHLLAESQQVLEDLCANQGWGCAVWTYRGYDSSGGTPDPETLASDGFVAWSRLLVDQRIQPDAVHVVGYSLGTSIAAAVAAQAHIDPPASLTLLAPLVAVYLGGPLQLQLHRYETSKWLGSIASPVLVIHGTRDTTLGIEHGRAVAQALDPRAQLLELPEVGHLDLPVSPAAQDAMRAFISRHATDPGNAARPKTFAPH